MARTVASVKRSAVDQAAAASKKARHSTIVGDTVKRMMDTWHYEENVLLHEMLLEKEKDFEEMRRKFIREKAHQERRVHLLEVQLNAAHRYQRMVEEWVPQVREMFAGDFHDLVEIRIHQRIQLEEQIQADLTDTE